MKFIIAIALEIYSLYFMAIHIGVLNTLLALLAGVVVGVAILQTRGFALLRQLQAHRPTADGLAVVAAGLLLIVPGFMSDGLAVLLLFPPTRWWIKKYLAHSLQTMVQNSRVVVWSNVASPPPAPQTEQSPLRDVTPPTASLKS